MPAATGHFELHRRVTAWYLVFGLGALAWLTLGLPLVVQRLVASRAEGACLARLGKAAALMHADLARSGGKNLPRLFDRLQAEGGLAWCAVVDRSGRYRLHSQQDLVGRPASRPTGAVARWGDVERVLCTAPHASTLREYQTPLLKDGRTWGTLRLAVYDPGWWAIVGAAAEYAPWVLVGPLLLMIAGAAVLRGTLRPLAEVEEQLLAVAASPNEAAAPLRPIDAPGPLASAWNRLVEERRAAPNGDGWEQRLAQALDGYQNRKAEQVLNSLPDGVALTDVEGRIMLVNEALAAVLDTGEPPAVGRRLEELLPLGPAGGGPQPLLAADLQSREVLLEVPRGGDAGQGVLRVSRRPLRAADAAAEQVWCVRDVTQQKLAEQMRNQFVCTATHELRTPLTNIKAYAETLAECEQLELSQQREFCNIINTEATRLARFIDDLLSISRMEAGSLTIHRQTTDMARLLRETVEQARPQMAQKDIQFESQLPEKLPELVVDKDKIIVTLVNLLGNAAKYTPAGGRVLLQAELAAGQLLIHVEDTGIGIAAEELPKVFEKFFRSSDPRVGEITGSGLGLALAQEIVRLHGGKIVVQSELNKGTRFTVALPA